MGQICHCVLKFDKISSAGKSGTLALLCPVISWKIQFILASQFIIRRHIN